MTPIASSPAGIGTPEVRLGPRDLERGADRRRLVSRSDPNRPAARKDPPGELVIEDPAFELPPPLAFGDPVQELRLADLGIEQCDRQPVGLESLGRPHADRFHDRLKVELLREGLAHLVHDRELGHPLTYLGRGADAAQRRADVLPDERQQANVVIGVELTGLVRLHDQRPQGPLIGAKRDSEPVDALHADHRDVALGRELQLTFGRHVLRLAGPEDERSEPARVADPERLPEVRIGNVRVDGVAVVREVDRPALVIEQGDEEVLAVHEAGDDLVDRRVELLQVAGGTGGLSNPVQRRLGALLLLQRRRRGLELRDPRSGSRERVGSVAHVLTPVTPSAAAESASASASGRIGLLM